MTQEKTADEMLEELGFKKTLDDLMIVEFTCEDNYIIFKCGPEMYECNFYGFGPKIHKAITKQMEELGWL